MRRNMRAIAATDTTCTVPSERKLKAGPASRSAKVNPTSALQANGESTRTMGGKNVKKATARGRKAATARAFAAMRG